MTHVLTQARLQGDSGSPEDVIVNTFHWDAGDVSAGNMENLCGVVAGFYTAIDQYLSPVLAEGGHEVRAYNMAEPEPRLPVSQAGFSITPVGGTQAYPNEVAVCLSFRAASSSGANMARRRGRIYIGPLNETTGIVSGSYVRPDVAFLDDLLDNAVQLAQAAETLAGAAWGVYSKADNVLRQVAAFWADNEWDTQRRRGVRATIRRFPGGG